jgi:1-acyl-sn-glycerol-3-phosphate acyltransferase
MPRVKKKVSKNLTFGMVKQTRSINPMRAIALKSMPKTDLSSISQALIPVYQWIAHGITKFVYRPRYIGFENIPKTGPAILISNHVSYVDGPIIDAGCGRSVRYLIDEDIYNIPGVHYIMSLDRAIPIGTSKESVARAFDEISETLKAGEMVCIFPEGFLTFTGGLGRFRHGIERIVKRDPVPVVPIALSGLWGSMFSRKRMRSPLRWLPREWLRGKVIALCGPAIAPEHVNVNYLQEVILKLKYSVGG